MKLCEISALTLSFQCKDIQNDSISFYPFPQSCFQFSLVWSIGASCDGASRVKFSIFITELFSGKDEEHPIPSVVGKIEHSMPSEHTVYDFMFEVT